MLKTLIINKSINYDGSQLTSHWILENFNLLGDAAVVFIGSAQVRENLVDLIDRKNRTYIYSPKMLHFIIEHFGTSLTEIILRQQILVSLAAETINQLAGKIIIERKGNDLFHKERKLSVSIATVSPVSGLIHLGLNIKTDKKIPVPAIGLEELKISPQKLGRNILKKYLSDCLNFEKAQVKVRGVK